MLTCVISAVAGYVGAYWQRASAFSLLRKRMRDLEVTISGLESSFESLTEGYKRLRSRTGMRELREREPEKGKQETKAEILARVFPGNKHVNP
jgi:hypothetical protein